MFLFIKFEHFGANSVSFLLFDSVVGYSRIGILVAQFEYFG